MKIEYKREVLKFNPIFLSITIESEEELKQLASKLKRDHPSGNKLDKLYILLDGLIKG